MMVSASIPKKHLVETGGNFNISNGDWETGRLGDWEINAISAFECYSFLKTIDYFP
jgi:hypothetical protein